MKCNLSGPVPWRVTKSDVSFAEGAVTVSRTCSVLPANHEIQLGRPTVATTVTLVPGATLPTGQTSLPCVRTGSVWAWGPTVACTRSTVPPPSGSLTCASAVGLSSRLAFEVVSSTPATTIAAIGKSTAATATILRNGFVRLTKRASGPNLSSP